MSFWEWFLIAVGLSMDAFAVSICKGLSVGAVRARHALTAGLWFGGFQALMPLLGWLLGSRFQGLITSVDHWIAFVLLCAIGGNMVRESRDMRRMRGDGRLLCTQGHASPGRGHQHRRPGRWSHLCIPSGGHSARGMLHWGGHLCIFLCGRQNGKRFGARYQSKAELFGGGVLIGMGIKILLEHLGVLG